MCCVSILHWHVSRPFRDDGLGNCQVFPYHTPDMCCVSTYKNIALARISTLRDVGLGNCQALICTYMSSIFTYPTPAI